MSQPIIEKTAPRIPWEADDLFPTKPSEGEFGYLAHDLPVTCSSEQLIQTIRAGRGRIPLVWTPAALRMVPAVEVPFLFDALKQRLTRRLVLSIVRSALLGIVLAGVMLLAGMHNQVPQGEARSLAMLLLIAFGVIPVGQGLRSLGNLRQFTPADMLYQGPGARYEIWLARKKLIATWVIAACILLIAAIEVKLDGLWLWNHSVVAAGLVKPLPRVQWWRLFTYAVLHGGLLHLGVNLFALIVLGRWVEAHSRRVYLPIVFLATALAGGVASLMLAPQVKYSVGSSGGLMGLIGFLTIMGYRRRNVLPEGFARMMMINIVLVFAMGGVAWNIIDNACHFGGLVGGLVIGLIVFRKPLAKYPRPFAATLGILSMLAILATTAWAAKVLLTPPTLPLVAEKPGLWNAAALFKARYDRPGEFEVTGGKVDATKGPVISEMVGIFRKSGIYSFQFGRRDRFDAEYEVRVVRVQVNASEPAGPVLISPEERNWESYRDGIVRVQTGAIGVIEWTSEYPPLIGGGWALVRVDYSDTQLPLENHVAPEPGTMPATQPAKKAS